MLKKSLSFNNPQRTAERVIENLNWYIHLLFGISGFTRPCRLLGVLPCARSGVDSDL